MSLVPPDSSLVTRYSSIVHRPSSTAPSPPLHLHDHPILRPIVEQLGVLGICQDAAIGGGFAQAVRPEQLRAAANISLLLRHDLE